MIIHGEMVFNKFSWHDDACDIAGWSDGIGHGRYTQTLMAHLLERVAGIESLPVVNALIAALCISLMLIISIEMLKIDKQYRVGLVLAFLSIPAIAGHMGYMGAFWCNMIGELLAIVGAYYVAEYSDIKTGILGSVLFAFAIGEYQCYITLWIAILFCYYVKCIIDDNCDNRFIYDITKRLMWTTIVGVILYLILLFFFLRIYHASLTSYAGTDSFGIVSVEGYISRCVVAYKDFIIAPTTFSACMFPFHWKGWICLFLILFLACAIVNIYILIRKREIIKCIVFLFCIIIAPIVFNFNYIMYSKEATHSLHVYHMVYAFVLICIR